MTELRRIAATWFVVLLLVAACGGGASSPPGDGTASPTDPPASQAATDGTPTDGPEATPGETQTGGGGGGTAGSACELATADEIGAVIGETVSVSMDSPGDPSYCIYGDSAGSGIVATSLMARGGGAAFGIWKTGAGVQQVDGLGDDAVFDPSTATLLVLKGDAVFSVTAGEGTDAEAQRLEWSKDIAEIAIGRM